MRIKPVSDMARLSLKAPIKNRMPTRIARHL